MDRNTKKVIAASYIGYITQAIVNNFTPLLFVFLASDFGVSLEQVTLLITMNFSVQLAVDLIASKMCDRIGYKPLVIAAHVFVTVGFICMGTLTLLPDPYGWLLVSSALFAIGGGLTEVIISPIVEACDTDEKSGAMSLLHSFYCWGQVFAVVVSTLFFALFGIENWRIMAVIWAIVPLFNTFFFAGLKIKQLNPEGGTVKVRVLAGKGLFWLLVVMMLCAGASELAMSQWASAFAQAGLGVDPTVGNLAGPCLFAVFMGSARAFYGKFSAKIKLEKFMLLSCALCIAGYLTACLSPIPLLGFIGCSVVGLSVGIMWPGTYSIAGARLPMGGTAMFALLALAGDLGCMSGPTAAGFISGATDGRLQTGLVFSAVFPLVLGIAVLMLHKRAEHKI